MIKRVAAVPGEPVPEAVWPAVAAIGGQSVPAGSLVVLGDNTADSKDSRTIGYIPADRVLGVMLHPLRIGR
jgi:type IV secretory pathway protease TraF